MESNHTKRPRGLGRGLETLLGGDSPLHTNRTSPSSAFPSSGFPADPSDPSASSAFSDPFASPASQSSPAEADTNGFANGSANGSANGFANGFANGTSVGTAAASESEDDAPIHFLRVSDIEPNPHQPRTHFDEAALQTLAESIRDNGLLQPLVVRRRPDENGVPAANAYQLIAGERRWRACRRAGLSEVPAIVMEADDLKMTELALIENLQRENLNPLEEARSYQLLMTEFGLSQSDAAARVGKSRPAVANAVRLLSLPDTIQDYVRSGELSAGHARALLTVENEADCKKLAERIIREALNVRQTEKLAAAWKEHQEADEDPQDTAEKPITEADVDHLAVIRRELSGLWGRKVDFREKNGKRFVTLEYYDNEDLEGLIEVLSKFRP